MIDPDAIQHELRLGDSRGLLKELPDFCVDALVTDPPAGISFMGKEWDTPGAFVERRAERSNDFDHLAGNHNAENNADKVRDLRGRGRRFREGLTPIFAECLRVLKPGAHGLVWALPRTSHWTATALEDAGFEIRDVIVHLFGTGFPKSLGVSKAIASGSGRPEDIRRLSMGKDYAPSGRGRKNYDHGAGSAMNGQPRGISLPSRAVRWQGWGTALKPAAEHWILVRKPLEGTVAENVLAHGTGALNIDGCRIGISKRVPLSAAKDRIGQVAKGDERGRTTETDGFNPNVGRWPANVMLDEEAAAMLDAQSGELTTPATYRRSVAAEGEWLHRKEAGTTQIGFGDSGGASRFFYVAKPDRAERDAGITSSPRTGGEATDRPDGSDGLKSPRAGAGRNGGARNFHPTVKAVSLMRWLVRLVTPPGGLVLDPFAGSGSTGIAAHEEGMRFLGFERDPEYQRLATERIAKAREQMRMPWAEGA